jgi:hypothetical protein
VFDTDKLAFSALLDQLGTAYGKDVTLEQKRLYWADLLPFALDAVAAACLAHRRQGKFFPTPADLLARIPGATHLAPEAAWAVARLALDETNTVFWTPEIAQALEAARDLWSDGNKYAAEKAFLKAYDTLRGASTALPQWQISVGHDADKRRHALEQAVARGQLRAEAAQRYLPTPDPALAGPPPAGLLPAPDGTPPPADANPERIAALLAQLRDKPVPNRAEAQRQADEANKQAVVEALAARGVELKTPNLYQPTATDPQPTLNPGLTAPDTSDNDHE